LIGFTARNLVVTETLCDSHYLEMVLRTKCCQNVNIAFIRFPLDILFDGIIQQTFNKTEELTDLDASIALWSRHVLVLLNVHCQT